MLGSTSPPNEIAALHLQVEPEQAASPQNVTSGQSARLLWTGLGVGVIMLIGVSACALGPLASHASAKPSRLVPEVASFVPGMPSLQPGIGHADPTALRPAVLPGANQGTQQRPPSTIRMAVTADKSGVTADTSSLSRRTFLFASVPFVLAATGASLGNGTMSLKKLIKMAGKLTPLQQDIALKGATEVPFTGKTTTGFGRYDIVSHDNKQDGMYLGAISSAPIFESQFKYDSGTGWPFMRLCLAA
jgi:hypothetical protein